MNGSDDSNALADDLESLRAGTLSVREFRTKYERNAAPAVGRAIWPNLEHYLSDGDIRARDPVYCAMQDAELTKLARLVRMGASDSELTTITFLRVLRSRKLTATALDGSRVTSELISNRSSAGAAGEPDRVGLASEE